MYIHIYIYYIYIYIYIYILYLYIYIYILYLYKHSIVHDLAAAADIRYFEIYYSLRNLVQIKV